MKRRDKQKNVNRKTREYSFSKRQEQMNYLKGKQNKSTHTHTHTLKYKEKNNIEWMYRDARQKAYVERTVC